MSDGGAPAASSDGGAARDPSGMWRLRGSDGSVAAGWYYLPLRLFLGVTFLYAGLQKLANPDFFRASSPVSIHAQLVGAARTSPIGSLLGHLVGSASGIGALIAVAEVAIGVGALLGLLTRVAAIGGMLVSFSLFLAVSFHSRPYFTGSDIVFLFAWTPLVLGGAAGAPALDTWLARRRAAAGSAVATGEQAPREGAMTRGAVVGLVAAASAVLIGVVTGVGRALAPASSGSGNTLNAGATTTTAPTATTAAGAGATTTTVPLPKGTSIGPSSQVPVGGSAAFTDPSTGYPSIVIQQVADEFKAFDAICPHAGCTVAYQASAKIIACPCHGSEFNPKNGDVIQGPATSGLNPIKVVEGSNGDLYVV